MTLHHLGDCEDCTDGICTMNCSSAISVNGTEWIAASIWAGIFPAKASAEQTRAWFERDRRAQDGGEDA